MHHLGLCHPCADSTEIITVLFVRSCVKWLWRGNKHSQKWLSSSASTRSMTGNVASKTSRNKEVWWHWDREKLLEISVDIIFTTVITHLPLFPLPSSSSSFPFHFPLSSLSSLLSSFPLFVSPPTSLVPSLFLLLLMCKMPPLLSAASSFFLSFSHSISRSFYGVIGIYYYRHITLYISWSLFSRWWIAARMKNELDGTVM